MNKCYICGRSDSLQEHHIWPQSAGGSAGPTVFLCPTDHTKIHETAINLESKQPKRQPNFSKDEWSRAQRLVEYIQLAIRKNRQDPNGDDPAKITITITKKELFLLHLIKKDSKQSNLNNYIRDLVRQLIRSKFPGA